MNDMQQLSQRTEKLIGSLTNAILSTAEAAAERIELASKVAQVQQRMTAFTSVLEAVAASKQPLLARIAELTDSPTDKVMRAMLTRQVEVLTEQELAILERAGAPRAVAQQAIEHADTPVYDQGGDTTPTHRRNGRKFERVNGAH